MNEPIHEEQYQGYTIKIYSDDSPESPRDWDNLGKMICFHSRYTLGDKHDLKTEDYDGWAAMEKHLRKHEGAVIVLPLALLDHSGITMHVGGARSFASDYNGWDSGQVGFYVVTKADIIKEYGKDTKKNRARAEKVMRGEIETYDNYLTGNIYGYQITDPNGCAGDSCWGFNGDYNNDDYGALKEARSVVDSILKNTKEFTVALQPYVVITVRAKDAPEATADALRILRGKVNAAKVVVISCEKNLVPTTRVASLTEEE